MHGDGDGDTMKSNEETLNQLQATAGFRINQKFV